MYSTLVFTAIIDFFIQIAARKMTAVVGRAKRKQAAPLYVAYRRKIIFPDWFLIATYSWSLRV